MSEQSFHVASLLSKGKQFTSLMSMIQFLFYSREDYTLNVGMKAHRNNPGRFSQLMVFLRIIIKFYHEI